MNQALMRLHYRHKDGLKLQMQSALFQNPDDMAELTPQEMNYKFASEADILNVALFGKTAKQWREETGNTKENMRDYASVEQLIILVNIESMNADLIREGLSQVERLKKLRSMAYYQMQSLTGSKVIQKLKTNLLEDKKET